VTLTAFSDSGLAVSSRDQTTVTALYTVATFIYYDVDGDSAPDRLEPGIAGVRISLAQATQPVASTTTASDGRAVFAGLLAGVYTLQVDPISLPADYLQVSPNNLMPITLHNGPPPPAAIGYTKPITFDSDCDQITDRIEGTADLDDDGLPDYLEGGCLYLPLVTR